MKSTNWSNTCNPRHSPRTGNNNLLRSSSLSNITTVRSAPNLSASGRGGGGGADGYHNQLDVRQERQEIREYLDRLRQLVPACPKAGKLSRLTVIQHVIDYIVQLQDTLLHHPVNTMLTTDDLHHQQHQQHQYQEQEQEVGVLGAEGGGGGGGGELMPLHYANPLDSDAVIALRRLNPQHNKHVSSSVPPTNTRKHRNSNNSYKNSNGNSTNSSSSSTVIRKNGSSCRRPLGVLSSLKNHRHQ